MKPSHLDRTSRMLEKGLFLLLGIMTILILAGAVLVMLKMDSSSQSQGGRYYVALAALVLLGAVDFQISRLVKRRAPFSLITTPQERWYALVSLSVMFLSAIVLIGLAWLLP